MVFLVNLGTLCKDLRCPLLYRLKTLYLSRAIISLSLGSCMASSSALHLTPDAETVAMTSSTAFSLLRTLALRVADILKGFFLSLTH